MAKSILIQKEGAQVRVQLQEGAKNLDEEVFPLDIHFDTMLVTSIDKILKRNRIDKVSPLDILLAGFGDETSMTSLIAQTVAEALKIK